MPTLLIAQAVLLSLLMAGGWVLQKGMRDGGWTDVVWSWAVGVAGAAGALFPLGGGIAPRQWLAAALVGLWSARLGSHLAGRVAAHRTEEPRYVHLRRTWGAHFDLRMAGFLQVQAAAGLPLAFAAAVAAHRPGALDAQDIAAVTLFAAALGGETAADRQLAAFRKAGRGPVCDTGLWRWSRHPNYFFEWLVWLAWPVLAIRPDWPWGWAALAAPALMYPLLRYGSGVPPLEAQMARTRGEAWRAYAARTSIFFPFPPRSAA